MNGSVLSTVLVFTPQLPNQYESTPNPYVLDLFLLTIYYETFLMHEDGGESGKNT